VAHIALTSYDLETGGISRVAVYLANGFAAAGHQVSLVVCNAQGDLHETLAGLLDNRVEMVTLRTHRRRSRPWEQILSLGAMRRWLRSARPDALVATSNNISWFTGFATFGIGRGGPALFIKTTNPILRAADGPLLTALRRIGYTRLFASAKAVLTLSEAESRVLASQFPQQAARFHAVFNPYLTPAFLSAPAATGDPGEARLLIGVGRLSSQKNFARLIEAFALARRQVGPDHPLAEAQLMIAGEGPLRGELEALVARLGLQSVVSLPGFAEDVPGLLARARRLVMSSDYEGLPAVVIEAMGRGCPVVTTDCFVAARELLAGLPACAVCDLSSDALALALIASMTQITNGDSLRMRVADYSLANAVESHLRQIAR
jgi:glycosyltransferase involved in cell wall biosynthesis